MATEAHPQEDLVTARTRLLRLDLEIGIRLKPVLILARYRVDPTMNRGVGILSRRVIFPIGVPEPEFCLPHLTRVEAGLRIKDELDVLLVRHRLPVSPGRALLPRDRLGEEGEPVEDWQDAPRRRNRQDLVDAYRNEPMSVKDDHILQAAMG